MYLSSAHHVAMASLLLWHGTARAAQDAQDYGECIVYNMCLRRSREQDCKVNECYY